MSTSIGTRPLPERMDHLIKVIASPRFLKMQGIGKEVPFFICPFKPEEALAMARMQQQLESRLMLQGIRILSINLYDLTVDMLKGRGLWDQILENESSIAKDELFELLDGVLDAKENLVPAIAERMACQAFDVLFITGIGEVYPYIRTHNLLENLQSTATDRPTVFFFPGTYSYSPETGAYLDLFDRLHVNKYYRAFDIFHYDA
jgi:hypothetical protein